MAGSVLELLRKLQLEEQRDATEGCSSEARLKHCAGKGEHHRHHKQGWHAVGCCCCWPQQPECSSVCMQLPPEEQSLYLGVGLAGGAQQADQLVQMPDAVMQAGYGCQKTAAGEMFDAAQACLVEACRTTSGPD